MTENGRFFVKKWSFLGYQNQIRVAISRSSRNHSRPYFHKKVASFKWLSKDILMFPARFSCLAESVQRHYSRNPGFGQKKNDRNGRFFVKKWPFSGHQNQIHGAIPRSSRTHSRPYFHQKLHQSSGFLTTY